MKIPFFHEMSRSNFVFNPLVASLVKRRHLASFLLISLPYLKEVTTPTTLKNFKSPPHKSQRELKFLGTNRLSKTLDNLIKKCIS